MTYQLVEEQRKKDYLMLREVKIELELEVLES